MGLSCTNLSVRWTSIILIFVVLTSSMRLLRASISTPLSIHLLTTFTTLQPHTLRWLFRITFRWTIISILVLLHNMAIKIINKYWINRSIMFHLISIHRSRVLVISLVVNLMMIRILKLVLSLILIGFLGVRRRKIM
jgi:hypothetical protein